MEQHAPPRFGHAIQQRLQRNVLRPRIAASLIVALWAVGVVVFGVVERLVNPETFDNVWLAMWWALQTVTTVGYGDVVPGDTAGKVMASFLMLGGLSLYAVVTGAITSAFVAEAQARRRAGTEDPATRRLEDITAQLEAIRAELARIDSRSD
jgi:voltage-gated potassium channel